MIIKIGRFINTETKEEWSSLIIDKISIAQQACQELVGGTINYLSLNGHSIYMPNNQSIFGTVMAKIVFKNMYEDIFKGETFIMNYKGGYSRMSNISKVNWKLLSTKEFDGKHGSSIKDLLLLENNIIKPKYKQVS